MEVRLQLRLMVAITLCIWSLGSTPKAACTSSTCGANSQLQTIDRGILRFGHSVEADGMGRREGADQCRIGPALDRRRRELKAYIYRNNFPTRGDKAVRAQSIRGRMALEGLYVPNNASWYATFRSELLSFPAGKYDDQVDALG